MSRFIKTSLGVAVAMSLISCSATQSIKNNRETITGCAVGTGIGALLGHRIGGNDGAWVGAAAGALIGCGIGHDMQKRRQALEQLAQQAQLDIEFASISVDKKAGSSAADMLIASDQQKLESNDKAAFKNYEVVGLAATVNNKDGDNMFLSGRAAPTPAARTKLKKLAEIYKESGSNILITGHSDASGNSESNQQLSEERAREVAKIFSEAGIPENKLYFLGAGDSQPLASNADEAGRAKNRRVEVVEISGMPDNLIAYASKQNSNIAFLSRRSQDKLQQHDTTPRKKETIGATTRDSKRDEPLFIPADGARELLPAARKVAAPLNFGGEKVISSGSSYTQLIGPKKTGSFSLISKAYAQEVGSLNCAAEGPRRSGDIKSLSTGLPFVRSQYNTSDYLPGMFGTVWTDTVNNHLVALSPVAVLKNTGKSVSQPSLRIWKDYSGQAGSEADYTVSTQVETYYGESGLLYRVFPQDASFPVRCMDLVMPVQKANGVAIAGTLYYDNRADLYEQSVIPKMLNN